MNYYKYITLKYLIGFLMATLEENRSTSSELDALLYNFYDLYGNKGLNVLQQHLNLLELFNEDDLKTALIHPNLLIAINDPIKEVAWILTMKKLKFDFVCNLLKNKIK